MPKIIFPNLGIEQEVPEGMTEQDIDQHIQGMQFQQAAQQAGPIPALANAFMQMQGNQGPQSTLPDVSGSDFIGLTPQQAQSTVNTLQRDVQSRIEQQMRARAARERALEQEKDRQQAIKLQQQQHKNKIAQQKLRLDQEKDFFELEQKAAENRFKQEQKAETAAREDEQEHDVKIQRLRNQPRVVRYEGTGGRGGSASKASPYTFRNTAQGLIRINKQTGESEPALDREKQAFNESLELFQDHVDTDADFDTQFRQVRILQEQGVLPKAFPALEIIEAFGQRSPINAPSSKTVDTWKPFDQREVSLSPKEQAESMEIGSTRRLSNGQVVKRIDEATWEEL